MPVTRSALLGAARWLAVVVPIVDPALVLFLFYADDPRAAVQALRDRAVRADR